MKKKEDLIYLMRKNKLKKIFGYRKTLDQYVITSEGNVYNRISRTLIPQKIDKAGNPRVVLDNKDGSRSSIKVETLRKYAFSDKNKKY